MRRSGLQAARQDHRGIGYRDYRGYRAWGTSTELQWKGTVKREGSNPRMPAMTLALVHLLDEL